MRCLALAEAWRERGGEVVFMTRCESDRLLARVTALVPDVVRLSAASCKSATQDGVCDLVRARAGRGDERPWVVLDGYHFDERYQRAVRSAGGGVLIIDDYAHLERYHADVLVNQNLGAEQLPYRSDEGTVFLKGPRYALLRAEFTPYRGRARSFPDVARKVLITAGASGPDEFLLHALESVQQAGIDRVEVALVVGPSRLPEAGFAFDDAWRSANPHVHIVEDAADLSSWMAWADVAIAAGGVTTWELAFMGVPAILVAIADNQRGAVRALAACGAAAYGAESSDVSWPVVSGVLAGLMHDAKARRGVSDKAASLVDGHGAERVTAQMLAS